MEKVAKPDFLDLDKDGNKKEPMKKAAVEAPKERLKTDRDGYRVSKKDADAARERLLAKARAKRAKMSEALDPVGKEDADVDNDGKKNTKSDKYLLNRRKAIGKAIATRKEEIEITEIHTQAHKPHEVPDKNLKGLVKKAVKRIDADNDGDVDTNDPKETEMGEFIPSPDGKKKVKTKVQKESYSNWRQELIEVADDEQETEIKEKKVKNKIIINPNLGESVEELGGTLIEMIEVDEIDVLIESVYEELIEEGYSEDDVEEAIEYSLIEAKVTYGHDTPTKRDEMMKKAKGRLRFLGRKAKEKFDSAKKKVGMASAQAQVAGYNKLRNIAQTAGDTKRRAKKAVTDVPKKAKKKGKSLLRRAAQKVVDRMSEETLTEKPGDGYLGPTPIPNPIRLAQDVVDATNRTNQKKVNMVNRTLGRDAASMPKHTYFNKGPSAASQRYLGLKNSFEPEGEMIGEKLNMKKEKMGDVIKDFYKSDAPQFKGKSKEKRREMAIAAKLTAERGGKKLGEENLEEGLPLALGAGAAAIGGAAYLINRAKKAADTHSDKSVGKPTVQGAASAIRNRNTEIEKLRSRMRNEEASDAMKDRRQERGGVGGNQRYDKAPKAPNTKKFGKGKMMAQKEMEKKHGKGASAMDIVKAQIRDKYGKDAIMDTKKKKK
jgi:hypothetical protein